MDSVAILACICSLTNLSIFYLIHLVDNKFSKLFVEAAKEFDESLENIKKTFYKRMDDAERDINKILRIKMQ